MFLYIVRHGIAYERGEWSGSDADRPLTDEGKEKTQAVFEGLCELKMLRVETIWASPLVRARQTAEIAGAVLKLPVKAVAEVESMPLKKLQARLKKSNPPPQRLMLVGHEPGCGNLLADLAGDPHGDYAFKKAGVAYLKGDFKPGGMKLMWKLAPKDVEA